MTDRAEMNSKTVDSEPSQCTSEPVMEKVANFPYIQFNEKS